MNNRYAILRGKSETPIAEVDAGGFLFVGDIVSINNSETYYILAQTDRNRFNFISLGGGNRYTKSFKSAYSPSDSTFLTYGTFPIRMFKFECKLYSRFISADAVREILDYIKYTAPETLIESEDDDELQEVRYSRAERRVEREEPEIPFKLI